MKYYFDPSFDVVNKNRYANLIKYLFLHYDQFVVEVVGNDFEHSVYRDVMYRSAKFDYWVYRRDRAYKYKECRRLGKAFNVKELISFEEFERDFKPPVIDAEISCLRLFIHVMREMFIRSSIVHDKNGRCFKLEGNGRELFKSVISDIITERFPNIDQESENGLFNCFAYTTTNSPNVPEFIPAYMFIFKLLKKKKLDFKHVRFSAESFPEFADMLTKFSAELEIKKILSSAPSTLDEDDIERAIYNRKEAEKHDEVKRMLSLPTIVEAYFNVYGNLPEN